MKIFRQNLQFRYTLKCLIPQRMSLITLNEDVEEEEEEVKPDSTPVEMTDIFA